MQKWLIIFVIVQLSGCQWGPDNKSFHSFGFKSADNPGLTTDYRGVITGNSITAILPFHLNRSSLKAAFTTTGERVEVDGIEQASGETVNDFTNPLSYVIYSDEGDSRTYSIDASNSGTKLQAMGLEEYCHQGMAVSMSGNYAIVGSTTVSLGSVHIYRCEENETWTDLGEITGYDSRQSDYFGGSVSIRDDYAIVGSGCESTKGYYAGAAYVLRRTEWNTWGEQFKLLASDGEAEDHFSVDVSICGDYAVVGAPFEDTAGTNAGAVYVFRRIEANTWGAERKLVSPSPAADQNFGRFVCIDGDYMIAGVSDTTSGAERAFVFHRTGENTWDSGYTLVAPDGEVNDIFGSAVSISGNYAIVGAPNKDGVFPGAGAAYVFNRTGVGNTWDSGFPLTSPMPVFGGEFGFSVSISRDVALIGALFDENSVEDTGAAYYFHRSGTNSWVFGGRLAAPDPDSMDYFGWSIAIDGDRAIIGSPNESERGLYTGAAYIF